MPPWDSTLIIVRESLHENLCPPHPIIQSQSSFRSVTDAHFPSPLVCCSSVQVIKTKSTFPINFSSTKISVSFLSIHEEYSTGKSRSRTKKKTHVIVWIQNNLTDVCLQGGLTRFTRACRKSKWRFIFERTTMNSATEREWKIGISCENVYEIFRLPAFDSLPDWLCHVIWQ